MLLQLQSTVRVVQMGWLLLLPNLVEVRKAVLITAQTLELQHQQIDMIYLIAKNGLKLTAQLVEMLILLMKEQIQTGRMKSPELHLPRNTTFLIQILTSREIIEFL